MSQIGDSPAAGLDPSLLADIESHATKLARGAGALLLDYFQRDLSVEYKSKDNQDPVTEADRGAESLLMEGITARFPDHGILSEETQETTHADGDFLWVLDPLDGTTNFINRYPCFGVSIGVLFKGVPVVGALFIPSPVASAGQVLHAQMHGGAFMDNVPVHVFGSQEPSRQGLLSMPGYFQSQFRIGKSLAGKLGNVRATGSIAYEMALVASGVFQYATFGGPKIWDVAAGVIIIREAGGEVLLRTRSLRHWEPLRSFLKPGAGIPKDGDMREWRAGLLVGNAPLIEYVASNLRRRTRPFRWLRHAGRLLGARARARGRHAEAPEEGRPDVSGAPPPDSEGFPPPQEPE